MKKKSNYRDDDSGEGEEEEEEEEGEEEEEHEISTKKERPRRTIRERKRKKYTNTTTTKDKAFQCCLCYNVARPPSVSCNNGCLMCEKCAHRFLESCNTKGQNTPQENVLCPVCRNKFLPLNNNTCIDKIVKDWPAECSHGCDMPGLTVSTVEAHESVCELIPVHCKYSKHGCTWIGNKGTKEEHSKVCVYRMTYTCHQLIKRHREAWLVPLANIEKRIEKMEAALGVFNSRCPNGAVSVKSRVRVKKRVREKVEYYSFKCIFPVKIYRFKVTVERLTSKYGVNSVISVVKLVHIQNHLREATTISQTHKNQRRCAEIVDAALPAGIYTDLVLFVYKEGKCVAFGSAQKVFTITSNCKVLSITGTLPVPKESSVIVSNSETESVTTTTTACTPNAEATTVTTKIVQSTEQILQKSPETTFQNEGEEVRAGELKQTNIDDYIFELCVKSLHRV